MVEKGWRESEVKRLEGEGRVFFFLARRRGREKKRLDSISFSQFQRVLTLFRACDPKLSQADVEP